MRFVLLSSFIVLTLTGCNRFAQEHQALQYAVVPLGSESAILTDQVSGDTWRLTVSGWAPISKLTSPPSELSGLIAEKQRRNKIYDFLTKSNDARQIAQQLKSGSISPEQARDQLHTLLPQALGPLPPGAEIGNWKPISE